MFHWSNISWMFWCNYLIMLSDLHESLMPLVPTDEQQRQNQWFSKVNKHKEGCIKDVEAVKITNIPPSTDGQ